ncbi:MAG: hypothetical protein JSR33_02030 [Proteobacteria bacterium]|nr:hypothetical protein [Pseudomonadota bacterium]
MIIGAHAQGKTSSLHNRLLLQSSSIIIHNISYVTPVHQVLIKAHIVNIDHNYTKELGINFSTANGSLATTGGYSLNLPNSLADADDFIIPIAALGQSIVLNATLSALEKSGHAQLISDPQLVTLDHRAAIIEAGQEIPYQQATDGGGTNVIFKKAVLRLQVTPDIQSNHQTILLHLVINQDQVSDLTVNGAPAISTQQLKTQVAVRNRNTLVLGGIMQEDQSGQQQGVPFLSHLPFIGALFRVQKQTKERRQLLILVTPVILT